MREILFKAKTAMIVGTYNCGKDDGEWVIGHLYCDVGKWTIRQFEFDRADYVSYEVDPETICQYTGLTDKNSKKIWENDILKGFQYPYLNDGEHNYFAEVTWFDNCPAFGIYTFKNPKSNVRGISEGNTEFMEEWNPNDWEVIGNVFDNSELIEDSQ